MVKVIDQQLNTLRSTLQHTVDNVKNDLEQQLESTATMNETLSSKLKKVPTQERGLLEIKRQQVVKENLYLYLLKKKEETGLALAATSPNAIVVDKPRISRKPISPKKELVYLGSLLVGFFIPFIWIVGKEVLQDTIKWEEDISALTNTTVIGTLYKARKNERIVVRNNTRTAVAEKFRLLLSLIHI